LSKRERILESTVKADGDVSKLKESALEITITAFKKDFPDEVSNLAEQLMKRPADFATDDFSSGEATEER
jgi:hypothetical protein